jgi:hypothetical protein
MNLDSAERSYASLVSGARAFGEVLGAYAPPAIFELHLDLEALAAQMKRESQSAVQEDS